MQLIPNPTAQLKPDGYDIMKPWLASWEVHYRTVLCSFYLKIYRFLPEIVLSGNGAGQDLKLYLV